MRYGVGCARKVRVLERQARVSHLALPEVLRLFFVPGLLSRRDRHGVVAAPLCFQALRNSSSLAIFAAIRRASSLLSNFAADRLPG
jgi:hypothetical protein